MARAALAAVERGAASVAVWAVAVGKVKAATPAESGARAIAAVALAEEALATTEGAMVEATGEDSRGAGGRAREAVLRPRAQRR